MSETVCGAEGTAGLVVGAWVGGVNLQSELRSWSLGNWEVERKRGKRIHLILSGIFFQLLS